MNRFLVATLGAVLAFAVADVSAQGRVRDEGRNEGRVEASGEGQPKENGYRGDGDQGRGQGRDGGGRGAGSRELAPQQYGRGQGEARGQVYGLSQQQQGQGRGYGQTPNYAQDQSRGGRGGGPGNQAGSGQIYGLGQFVNNDQRRGDGRQGHRDGDRNRGNHGRGDGRGYGYSRNDRGYVNDRHGRSDWGYNGRGYGNRHNGWRDNNWRRSWNHGWNGSRYRSPTRYHYPRGYRSSYWGIGLVLPRAYYAPNYYVSYSNYGLAAPPYGCHWVRVENDVLLIDIATGEVVDALYGFFY